MTDTIASAWLDAALRGDPAEVSYLEDLLRVATELEQPQQTLADAAIQYAKRGISVFPLKPNGKTPITPKGFKDATVDLRQVAGWWRENPYHNIGLPTGHLFDVIDIDPPGAWHWARGHFNDLTILGHALTSRPGGHHLYVPTVEGMGNKAGALDGVDYRGLGGYVVAPPSIGPTGRQYTWLYPLEYLT